MAREAARRTAVFLDADVIGLARGTEAESDWMARLVQHRVERLEPAVARRHRTIPYQRRRNHAIHAVEIGRTGRVPHTAFPSIALDSVSFTELTRVGCNQFQSVSAPTAVLGGRIAMAITAD